ncbi:unnamed protein product [Cylindrotheca closterium]|uniref:Uncharacterized protein n=1 Tax=Cylindrotheca closterium TaxID=2856 RepID=A0AAD2CPE0_9STRA|nr:unnamed protein product [Cylindrotheca closterium]
MGFFSRKLKKTAQCNAVNTASESGISIRSTPGTKDVPTTPETADGAESPGTAAPTNPASISAGSETMAVDIQEPKVEDDKKSRAKKKHRTRISVTTPDKSDKDTNVSGAARQNQDDNTPPSTQHFDEPEMYEDNNTKNDAHRSGDTEGDETGLDNTLFLDDDEENLEDDENIQSEDTTVNRNLLGSFEGCDIFPDALKAMLPESWQQRGNGTAEQGVILVEKPPKKMSYYSEEFATKFLQELLKSGFALVYHQPSLTIEEEKADWQGRSVTMNFKTGVCNALEVFQPEIEWSTMGGGKETKILTRSVSLLDIHSVSVSSADDMRDNLEAGEIEEIQCFFTLTTKTGDIHVFEAMHINESKRLVLGIKNISGRYSNLVVAGDPRVVVEYFDNSSDPQEIRLPFERAIVQVSHAFLD